MAGTQDEAAGRDAVPGRTACATTTSPAWRCTSGHASPAAGPGEVLVTSTVRDLVSGSDIEFADRGGQALKGIPGEWQVLAGARQG